MALKDWKKIKDNEQIIEYKKLGIITERHGKRIWSLKGVTRRIQILHEPDYYLFLEFKYSSEIPISGGKIFKTREKVIAYAKHYMRTH